MTALRSQRKQDLLLASRLARGQAIGAFDELAGRADDVADRILSLRAWAASPTGLAAGTAAATLVLTVMLRRGRSARLLRWGWSAWRWWRGAAPLLAAFVAPLMAQRSERSARSPPTPQQR